MCAPPDLDCVETIRVAEEECPELCEGTITEVEKLTTDRSEEGWDQILAEYEKYKFPHSANLTLPYRMKGCSS